MQTNTIVNNTIELARSFIERYPNENEIQKTYGYFTNHPFAPLNRKRLQVILDLLEKRKTVLGRKLRVLDLACGGGLITAAITALGHSCVGFDFSHEEVRLAKIFNEENRLSGTFLQADLIKDSAWEKNAENALGGKPDIIILAYALHHLPQVEYFVERLGKWLDPGCTLIVNEENPASPVFRMKHILRGWIQKDTDVEWHRSLNEWQKMLAASGFHSEIPLTGLDMLPLIDKIMPSACWSLVFSAEKN